MNTDTDTTPELDPLDFVIEVNDIDLPQDLDSSRSDEGNNRGPTSGEAEFYSTPTDYDVNRPRKGPLAGLDLVAYMRTGTVLRYDGRPLTPAQAALR